VTRNGQQRGLSFRTVGLSTRGKVQPLKRFSPGGSKVGMNQPARWLVSPCMKHSGHGRPQTLLRRVMSSSEHEGDDPVKKAATFALSMLTLYGASTSAHAAGFDFLGTWTVATSEPAPWADAKEQPVASDLKALIGHSVSFQADRIDAPAPLKCRKPKYEIKPYTPDMLFQGSLTDPKKQALALGFAGDTIPTVETGCEGAIDFHFLNADNAIFGLNNRIYKIQRSKP
jgi:hypothetical protein